MNNSVDLDTNSSAEGSSTKRVKHPLIVTMPVEQDQARPIRSFALRGGHMSEAQKRAYDQGMKIWSLPFCRDVVDHHTMFGNNNPVVFEIGFGMGETTATIAAAHPELNFLAAEVYTSGVGSLMKRIIENKLTNIRVIQHDAVEVLNQMLAPDSLHGVHIYFPDPWHKARHNKRRLIQPPFIRLLSQRIQPGGYLHCATDWQDYAMQMLNVLSQESQLTNTADTFAPTPSWRPQTKFETRGLKLGHGVWDLLMRRTTNKKTFDEFAALHRTNGFDEVLERRWEPGTVLETHTHPFDAQVEVIQGDLWLTLDGQTRHLISGDTFAVDRQVPHSERYGLDGATVWVARRNAQL